MPNNELIIGLFSCPKELNELKFIQELMSMYGFFNQLVSATREYERCLDFTNWALSVLQSRKNELTLNEYEILDKSLIVMKLDMLDYTNQWRKYLDFFKEMRQSRHYLHQWNQWYDGQRFDEFVVKSDGKRYWVHFLYRRAERESTILRKYERQIAGKSTEHLKRHPKSNLTDDEIVERYTHIRHHIQRCLTRK